MADRSSTADRVDLGVRELACAEHGAFSSTGIRYLGKVDIWSKCPGCEKARMAAERARAMASAAEASRERLEAALERSAVPRRFVGRSFDGFVASTDGQQRALEVARGYADGFDQRLKAGHGLIFSGLPGTGKSHLAAAILQAIMPARVGFYVTCMGLIRMVRNTWRKDSERSEGQVLAMLAGVDLLVIDEVGVQYGTDGEQTVLFEVLDMRYQDQLPTILLTNQDKDGFKGYVGERSFDRLTESCRWVAFDWESHRPQVRKARG